MAVLVGCLGKAVDEEKRPLDKTFREAVYVVDEDFLSVGLKMGDSLSPWSTWL